MKPLKLVLQAFGPFAKTECIDFTALGQNPLFLINGPTGAGKSSILDAICFALFGQTTGAERDATQMRCDHADDSLITEVILDFSLGSKHYRIRRIPTQSRPRTRGEGFTDQKTEAQLWLLDDSAEGELLVAKKVSDATTQIEAMLGLTVEQFRQVIVLPQGKFRELLMANSTERENIFSQLFQTHIYKRIEDQLKVKAAAIKQAVAAHSQQIKGILQSAMIVSEAELDEERAQLVIQLIDAANQKDLAQQEQTHATLAKKRAEELKQRFVTFNERDVELKEKETRVPHFQAQQLILDSALNAEKIEPLYKNNQAKTHALAEIAKQLSIGISAIEKAVADKAHFEALLNTAKQDNVKVDSLKIQHHQLTQCKAQVTQLESARLNATHKAKAKQVSQTALDSQMGIQTKLTKELAELDLLNTNVTHDLIALAPKQIEWAAQRITLSNRTKLEDLYTKKRAVEESEAHLLMQLTTKQNQFEASQVHKRHTELAWHTGQAVLLATELKVGMPCSVCGSREHPLPARVAEGTTLVTKQHIDEASALEDTARTWMQKAEQEWSHAKAEVKVIQVQLAELEETLSDSAQQTVEHITQVFNALEVEVNRLLGLEKAQRANLVRMDDIKQQLPTVSQAIAILQVQANDDNTALIKALADITHIESTIPEEYRDAGKITQQLSIVEATIIQLNDALTHAQQGFTDKQSTLIALVARQEELGKQEKALQIEHAQTTLAWSHALEHSVFSDTNAFQSALLSDEAQQVIKGDIETFRNTLTGLRSVVAQLKEDLKAQLYPDLEKLEQELNDKTSQFNATDEIWRKFEERNNLLKNIKTQLNDARKITAKLEADYQIFGTLSDVATGMNGRRISLQRFVLSVLLDDVLIQASHRLNLMSKGRYRLLRKEERMGGNAASGLDMEVEDGYTGKTRAVATLSGGESFMAALSLALGLSDVVQSYAGGIKLDTLFIDEGFGSLDPESLDLAIRTLMDLQSSGRMIGIISHVTELKEQMALRIDVKSSRDGSSIYTVGSRCD